MEIIRDGVKHILFPWVLRDYQVEIIKEFRQFNCIAAHRRFGKTVLEIVHMFLSALHCKKHNPRYMYITPQKAQAKANVWDEYIKPMVQYFPNYTISETDLEVTFDPMDGYGIRKILVRGADEGGKSLKGAYLDGLVMDEMREHVPQTFSESLLPMLIDRNGWAVFTGTVGLGYWYEFFHQAKADTSGKWKTFEIPASQSKALTAAQIETSKATMSPNDYSREFECNWMAEDTGAVFSATLKSLEGSNKITDDVKHNPSKPVITCWDIGQSDMTSIWFIQMDKDTYNVIDYLEVNQDTADNVLGKSQGAEAFDHKVIRHVVNKPYDYGIHILPHDAAHAHASAQTSTYKKLQQLSPNTKIIIAPKLKVQQGVEALSYILPKCRFHKGNCSPGIASMHSYIPPYSTNYKRIHKKFTHSADALRMFAVSVPHINTSYKAAAGIPINHLVVSNVKSDYDPL